MKQVIKQFDELTVEELHKIYRLRCEVFIVEQQSTYLDVDDVDLPATHIWIENDNNDIVAYARAIPPNITFDEPSIGRIIARDRGRGYGKKIVNICIDYIFLHFSSSVIKIEAQVQAKGFYEKLGFMQTSEPFDDEGIMHIEMVLKKD